MRRSMTSPVLALKILLIENDPAAANEIRTALTVRAAVPSKWNGFNYFLTVLSV